MKMVTLTKDMRPWRSGDRVPLPDAVADSIVASGEGKDAVSYVRGQGEVPDKPGLLKLTGEYLTKVRGKK